MTILIENKNIVLENNNLSISFYSKTGKSLKLKTIEDLVKYNLTLREQAREKHLL